MVLLLPLCGGSPLTSEYSYVSEQWEVKFILM